MPDVIRREGVQAEINSPIAVAFGAKAAGSREDRRTGQCAPKCPRLRLFRARAVVLGAGWTGVDPWGPVPGSVRRGQCAIRGPVAPRPGSLPRAPGPSDGVGARPRRRDTRSARLPAGHQI
ncbi:hypothetical protein GCM10010219_53770 [Streptomyces netropsis]|nr:hypothetical protein GCM10010219_53770 [Streptomyces netropsis]